MTGENSAQNAAITVAAFAVERAIGGARGSVAGLVVQPVVWAVTGNGPDAADSFIYGMGALGAVAGVLVAIPAVVTGVIKAAVDDYTAGLVEEARLDEPAAIRNGIQSISEYSFAASGGHIQAMVIANAGGVAWEHPNGVWLFLRDAAGLPVCDFVPQRYDAIRRPILPLSRNRNGNGVAWTSVRP